MPKEKKNSHWDLKVIGQWIVIVAAAIGIYIAQDRRITALEAGWVQERIGYAIATTGLTARLDRIENKLDRIIENR
jgi:hypothetical protein